MNGLPRHCQIDEPSFKGRQATFLSWFCFTMTMQLVSANSIAPGFYWVRKELIPHSAYSEVSNKLLKLNC